LYMVRSKHERRIPPKSFRRDSFDELRKQFAVGLTDRACFYWVECVKHKENVNLMMQKSRETI